MVPKMTMQYSSCPSLRKITEILSQISLSVAFLINDLLNPNYANIRFKADYRDECRSIINQFAFISMKFFSKCLRSLN